MFRCFDNSSQPVLKSTEQKVKNVNKYLFGKVWLLILYNVSQFEISVVVHSVIKKAKPCAFSLCILISVFKIILQVKFF